MHLSLRDMRKYLLPTLLVSLTLLLTGCSDLLGSSGNSGNPSSAPTAPATSSNASIVQRHSSAISVSPGSSATASISCQGNEQLVGGGYYIVGAKGSATVSYPSSLVSWIATLHNTTKKTQRISAFINCLVASFSIRPKLILGGVQGTNAGAKALTVMAKCPGGSVLTGGGYLTEMFQGTVDTSAPDKSQNQWLVMAHATGRGSMSVQSFAICATAHLKAIYPRLHSDFTISPGRDNNFTYACPENALLTSGGYTTNNATTPSVFYGVSSPDSIDVSSPGPVTQWVISGTSYDNNARQASIWLTCLQTA
jgi:hypothetical protein